LPEAGEEEASVEPTASQEGGCSCSSVGRRHETLHWELWVLAGLCVVGVRKQRRSRSSRNV
jgi:hypothetical protein